MKPCPYCGEMIQEDAKKCKHCGEYLDPALRQASPEAAKAVGRAAAAVSTGRRPWRPRVSGWTSFFLTFLGGAIVTYTNLRRLGNVKKANWVLISSFLACVPLAYLYSTIPEGRNRGGIYFPFSVVGAFLFPAIQRNEFRKWQSANPGVIPRNGWSSVGLGFVGLVVLSMMGVMFDAVSPVKNHVARAEQLLKQKNFDPAISEFREALRLKPNMAQVHNDLGYAYMEKGDLMGAVAEFREAVRLEPGYAIAHYNLGNALAKRAGPTSFAADPDRMAAIEEFRTAYRLAPNNPRIRATYEKLPPQ